MALIYQCEKFRRAMLAEEKAVRDRVINKLRNLEKRDELIPDASNFKQYGKSRDLRILKTRGVINTRTIIQEVLDTDLGKLYFVREFVGKDRYDYDWVKEIEVAIEDGNWLVNNPLSSEEYGRAISEFKNRQTAASLNKRPMLTPELRRWIQDFRINVDFDVFETAEWGLSLAPLSQHLYGLWQIARGIIKNETEDLSIRPWQPNAGTEQDANCQLAFKENIGILYEIEIDDQGRKLWLLRKAITADEWLTNGTQHLNSEFGDNENLYKQIPTPPFVKRALKAYPQMALNNFEVWKEIQNNGENSNLALDPFQIKLLECLQFPKFINGQAGSGKSTMLCYLFAEICALKLIELDTNDPDTLIPGEPVFLTENRSLLESTRNAVKDLLRTNPQYSGYGFQSDMLSRVDEFFLPFREFIEHYLLSDFLEDDKEPNPFVEKRFISFSTFKKLYADSKLPNAVKKRITPELVWFVVSTYIKGYDEHKLFDPDDFEALPRRDTSLLEPEVFRSVYEDVWKPFYSGLTEGPTALYYDQMDIVRDILNRGDYLNRRYVTVFCDESQDFSRIELRLLLRLSEYSNYDLSREIQVPIVFAGDPFQTVNPTGFHLDNLKDLFHNLLAEDLHFALPKDWMNDLKFNHRSSPPIVRLANLVQFFRSKHVGAEKIDLQKTKLPDSDELIPLITLDETQLHPGELHEKLRMERVITPCDYGEEEHYKEQDFWLRESPIIVSSAVSTKGSEYDRVVVYGFGQEFCNRFRPDCMERLLNGAFVEMTQSERFGLMFFFNKLYVSVTRARNRLVLIDTSEGIEKFWKALHNPSLLKRQQWARDEQKASDDTDEAPCGRSFESARFEDFEDPDPITAYRNAEQDERRGMDYQNADSLHRASRYYRLAGMSKDAARCEAYADEFDALNDLCNWDVPIEKFIKLSDAVSAARCAWLGGCWEKLLSIQFNGPDHPVKQIVANFMHDPDFDLRQLFREGKRLKKLFRDQTTRNYPSNWRPAFLQRLAVASKKNLAKFSENECLDLANFMSNFNEPMLMLVTAEVYFQARDYVQAVECFENAGAEVRTSSAYLYAKLQITADAGERISLLVQGNPVRFHEILDNFENHSQESLSKDGNIPIVIESIIRLDKLNYLVKKQHMAEGLSPATVLQHHSLKQYPAKYFEYLIRLKESIRQRDPAQSAGFLLSGDVFEAIMAFIRTQDIHKALISQPRPDRIKFDKVLRQGGESMVEFIASVLILAAHSRLTDILFPKMTDPQSGKPIYDFNNLVVLFLDYCLTVRSDTTTLIRPVEIAAAIERSCGIYTDILGLYEKLLKTSSLTEKEYNFLVERWACVKLKQRRKDKSTADLHIEIENALELLRRELVNMDIYFDLQEIEKLPDYPIFALEPVHGDNFPPEYHSVRPAVEKMIRKNMETDDIADIQSVSVEYVKWVQRQIN